MSALVNFDKIKSLIYTEKSNKQIAEGKYQFEVSSSCKKDEIASLVKKSFGVDVEKVNVINVKPKTKRFKGIEGKTGSFKKAVVTLKKGQTINFGS
jgi:large subunit ribosomal protein L23